MAGIASNPDPLLSLAGPVAAEGGGQVADKGMLSLFETTLSGLMPVPDPAPDAPASAMPVSSPGSVPASASTPSPARPQSSVLATVASWPMSPQAAPAPAADALPTSARDEQSPVTPVPQDVTVAASSGDASAETGKARVETLKAESSPADAEIGERQAPAMRMRGTLLASHLLTSRPTSLREVTTATDSGLADPAEPLPATEADASTAWPAQAIPLPPALPAAPVSLPEPVTGPALADRPAVSATPATPAGKPAAPAPERPTSMPDATRLDAPQTATSPVRQPGEEVVRASLSRIPAAAGGTRDAAAVVTSAAPAAIPTASPPPPTEAIRTTAASQPPVALAHTPLQSPAWAHVASQRLAWMVQGGESSAMLAINPESLGPIHVRIQMDGQSARIDLAAQQPVTATLLESHLPRLTAALESQGVRIDELKVGNQALAGDFSGAQNPFSGQQAEAGGQGARQPRWLASAGSVGESRPGTSEAVPISAPRRAVSRPGEVDDFA